MHGRCVCVAGACMAGDICCGGGMHRGMHGWGGGGAVHGFGCTWWGKACVAGECAGSTHPTRLHTCYVTLVFVTVTITVFTQEFFTNIHNTRMPICQLHFSYAMRRRLDQ